MFGIGTNKNNVIIRISVKGKNQRYSIPKVKAARIAAIIAILFALVLVLALWGTRDRKPPYPEPTGETVGLGLPYFITDEMMKALFETQARYGIPVSTGLAMIIAEGGFGNYGPGGEYGQGLSLLSYQYKNLFGIKYWSGMEYATGSVDLATWEQMEDGETYYYDGNFAVFASYRDAIHKRAWMLLRSPYVEHIEPYLNLNARTYTREQANAFMHGIREGGWATDLLYAEKNIHHMEFFDLYRFDNMTYREFLALIYTIEE